MTNERAIELLNRISDSQFDGPHGDERREALEMAVRALFSQQTVNDSQGLVNDCISRKMAIDAFEPEHDTDWYTPQIIEVLEALPSAQPETHDKRTETHTCDLISREKAIDIVRNRVKRFTTACVLAVTEIEKLPPAQPEYEPVTAEDFAKTMSENTLYSFMAWHHEVIALMNEMGFPVFGHEFCGAWADGCKTNENGYCFLAESRSE